MHDHVSGTKRPPRRIPFPASPLLILLTLGACSSDPTSRDEARSAAPESPADATAQAEPVPSPAPESPQQTGTLPAVPGQARNTIGLEGLGDLKIGSPVPQAGSWRERGAQINEGCRTITSPDFPGIYAIVEGGQVRRITVGQGSNVKLVEGVGIGTASKAVQAAFPGLQEEPHKYVAAPAKYFTAPTSAPGAPALRFEIGADNKVSMFHVGVKPTLDYVEGCA